MRIICVGVEHSGTRWVTGLLWNHPDVEEVHHISFPSGPQGEFVNLNEWIKDKKLNQDNLAIVVVSRDASCNTKSINKSSGAAKNRKRIIDNTPKNNIFDACLYELKQSVESVDDNISVVHISYESLLQWRNNILKQTFKTLGLNVKKYNYDFKGTIKKGWISVEAIGKDGNKKYIK